MKEKLSLEIEFYELLLLMQPVSLILFFILSFKLSESRFKDAFVALMNKKSMSGQQNICSWFKDVQHGCASDWCLLYVSADLDGKTTL